MVFNLGSQNDSSDEEAVTDLSVWQNGAKSSRSTSPRRTSGFKAVNQPPAEDIAMQSSPDPESPPVRQIASFARMQPAAEPMVVSSGKESSSDDEGDVPVVPAALPYEVEEEQEDDVWATVDEVVGDFAAAGEEEEEEEEDISPVQLASAQISNSGEGIDALSQRAWSVEVVVSRSELRDGDLANVVVLTAGGDVVRRILAEREDRYGMMECTVEFEDYHVEEVRSHVNSRVVKAHMTLQYCCLHLDNITTNTTQQLTAL
jgi:hypothetical protein